MGAGGRDRAGERHRAPVRLPWGGSTGRAEMQALPRSRSWPVASGVQAQGPPNARGDNGWKDVGAWVRTGVRGFKASQPPAVSSFSDGFAAGRVGFHDSNLAKPQRRLARFRADVTTCRLQFRVMLPE